MSNHIQLAWRNIWRNKKRTLITGASVFFGVFFASFMTSMQEGSYAQMIKTIVNSYSGHLQVLKKGYWEDKTINNTLEYNHGIQSILNKTGQITTIAPRIESYALVSSEELTKGVMVIGIESKEEDYITNLSKKITNGKYLEKQDSGVIIGSSLASYMQLYINDTLVLLSQGFHGAFAAGKYRIQGIIKHPSPDFDRGAVYMNLKQCQDLFSAPNRLTSIVIMTQTEDNVYKVKKEIAKHLGSNYDVKDWKEINRVLLKQIESDRASGVIVKGLLYLIIAFGIFATVMMMTLERKKEFGILIAIGMQKRKLNRVLLIETFLIGLLGSIAGIIFSIPIVWYYLHNPIEFTGQAAESFLQMGFEPVMSFSIAPSVFYRQSLIILGFSLLIGLYPILFISKLKINKALHS